MISVVVVTCNNEFALKETLASLSHPKIGQIVVVDDAGTDETASYIRTHFPHIYLIVNPRFLGKARSLNRACMVCIHDYILLLEPGMQILNFTSGDWCEIKNEGSGTSVTIPSVLRHEYFIYIPYCFTKTDSGVEKCLPTFKTQFIWKELVLEKSYQDILNSSQPIWPYEASCLLFNKSFWDFLNGFSTLYFPFGLEILDFVYRAKKNGATLDTYPELSICQKISHPYAKGFYSEIQLNMIRLKNNQLFLWNNVTSFKLLLIVILKSCIDFLFFRFKKIRVLILAIRFLPQLFMDVLYRPKSSVRDEELIL